MAKHSEIGIKGEEIAVEFLKKKGFEVLELNWRSGQKEVDIIAQTGDMLVFVEVKTRRNKRIAFPEEAVGLKKQLFLQQAAAHYYDNHKLTQNYRFDIVSIVYSNGVIGEIIHFEAAF
ncbi:MAG: hypothetical protein EBZ77_15305 [Chitinophagia bacterium]|nr:hypothetical protein [Chitinophagia bacterium]